MKSECFFCLCFLCKRLSDKHLLHHATRYYYCYDAERLKACRLVFHYLLHTAICIRRYGPPSIYWSYVMERYCGMLGPLVHSRVYPYRNLTNTALLLERLCYIDLVYESYALDPSETESASKTGGDLLGRGETAKLSKAERKAFRDGYERILSVKDKSKVCLSLRSQY
jgi:hypothetical protein